MQRVTLTFTVDLPDDRSVLNIVELVRLDAQEKLRELYCEPAELRVPSGAMTRILPASINPMILRSASRSGL